MLPVGDYLYLGTRDFLVFDIRDPQQPKHLRTIQDRTRVDRLNGFVRRGHFIFAANKEGTIDAFDVFVPAQPKLFGSLNVDARDGIGKPHDIDLFDQGLVVVDPAGFGRRRVPGKVAVYRVFHPMTGSLLPPDQWALVGTAASPLLVGGNRVRTTGKFAFVAASISPDALDKDQRQACVAAVDLTTPTQPAVTAKVPFPDVRGPNGMCVIGRVVFVAGGQNIMAVDISQPRQPQLLAAMRCTEVFSGEPGLDDGHDLVYRAGFLYVTGQTTHSLGVLKVVDPNIRALAEQAP